jgi:hypothetical protein
MERLSLWTSVRSKIPPFPLFLGIVNFAWILLSLALLSCSTGAIAHQPDERSPDSSPKPEESKPALNLEAKKISYEIRKWFPAEKPECGKKNSGPYLESLKASLLERCLSERTNDRECKVRELQFNIPPVGISSKPRLCEFWALIVRTDEGSVNFQAHTAIGNKTTVVGPRQAACLQSLQEKISKFSPNYRVFMRKVSQNPNIIDSRLMFSFCASDYMLDEKVWERLRELTHLPKSELGLELLQNTAPQIYFHEMTHLLSTFGAELGGDTALTFENRPTYEVLEVTQHTQAPIVFDQIKGSPRTHEIYEILGDLKMSLNHREKYFGPDQLNNFYLLIDEWNAYLNQLEFTLVSQEKCSEITQNANSILEFMIFTETYNRYLEKKNPNLFKVFANNSSFQRGIGHLLDRSQMLLERAEKTKDCKVFEGAAKYQLAQKAFTNLTGIYGR